MTGTEDLFTPIHKALRSMIYGLSGRLQTVDFADLDATRALVADLESDFAVARSAGCIVCVLSHHADDEETAIFPHVSPLESDLVGSLIEEHHQLTRLELSIADAAHQLMAMERPEMRIAAGVRLNQAANELFGAYIVHMNREERELVPRMRERFSDEQMASMQGVIIARMPPERVLAILGYMLPSLNVTELTKFVGVVQRTTPPPVQKAVVDLCGSRVDPDRWNAVRSRLGI